MQKLGITKYKIDSVQCSAGGMDLLQAEGKGNEIKARSHAKGE